MQLPVVILTLLISGILAGASVSWLVLGVRLSNGEKLLPYEPRKPVPWDGFDLLAGIAIYFLAQIVCLQIAMQIFGLAWPKDREHPSPDFQLALFASNLAASAVVLIACIAVLKLRAGATLTDLGIDLKKVSGDLKIGLIGFLAAAPVVYAIQRLLANFIEYKHPLIEAVEKEPSPTMVWITTISAVVAAPVVEEFLFRVMLQGWLEQLPIFRVPERAGAGELPVATSPEHSLLVPAAVEESSPRDIPTGVPGGWVVSPAVLISSTLFALVHFGHGAAPIPLFFFGLVLGYLYQQTHRWLPSVTVHMLLNGVSMVGFFLSPAGGK